MFESAVVQLIRLASTFQKYLTELLVLLQLFDFKVIVMIGIKIRIQIIILRKSIHTYQSLILSHIFW